MEEEKKADYADFLSAVISSQVLREHVQALKIYSHSNRRNWENFQANQILIDK
jgi:hypothetical protein